jgi:hypothetical protein
MSWVLAEIKYNDNRTVQGSVEYKSWLQNPSEINFSTRRDSFNLIFQRDIIRLTPENILEIRIDGKDVYRSANIIRYMNPLRAEQISDFDNEPERKEYVFLRLLSDGDQIAFYTYVDNIKSHYFIRDSLNEWKTLRYVRFIKGSTYQLIEKKLFQNQLSPYVLNNKKAERVLTQTGWHDEDMIKLAKAINTTASMSFAEKERLETKKNSGFIAGVAISAINFGMISKTEILNNLTFNNTIRPELYIGWRFSAGRSAKKLSFQFLGGWYSYKVTGTYDWYSAGEPVNEKVIFKYNTLYLGTDILYSASETKRLLFELGININSMLPTSVTSERTTTERNQVTGALDYREPINLNNTSHFTLSIVSQLTFLKNNVVRLSISPEHKVDDYGMVMPRESKISLGYHYLLRKN